VRDPDDAVPDRRVPLPRADVRHEVGRVRRGVGGAGGAQHRWLPGHAHGDPTPPAPDLSTPTSAVDPLPTPRERSPWPRASASPPRRRAFATGGVTGAGGVTEPSGLGCLLP